MKKTNLFNALICCLFLIPILSFSQSTWINEFHYDNSGGDVGEFVEVVSGVDASLYQIVLYNGSTGASYSTFNLSLATTSTDSGYTFYVANIAGIQNGAPDGIALVDDSGTVLEFISYEGTFMASNGPAAGMSSTDVGISEPGAIGESIQLSGTGSQASDFVWGGPTAESPGSINSGQSLTAGEDVTAPNAFCQNLTVELNNLGQATISASDVDNGSNDDAGGVTLSIDRTTFDCSDVSTEEAPPSIWINEFHYDNSGTDVGEFVEVVSNFDAGQYQIVLYNGNGGGVYNTFDLSSATTSSESGYTLYVASITGIQNGAPDGIALVDDSGVVVEFISYEGTFQATDGPANGMTSTDVGISEPGAVGESIQLSGSGSQASDFTWGGPTTESPGTVNTGQSLSSLGGIAVTLTVEDDNGNIATCVASVTVVDNEFPSAICQNFNVQLDETGNATILPSDLDGGSSDNCGAIALSIDRDSFTCADIGATIANSEVWINEFHYDNSGTDVGEFVEVVSNFDAGQYQIVLYNGNGGGVYNTFDLSSATTSSESGYTLYVASITGIQNGAPDGIALVDDSGVVVEFISYEGTFQATDGPANGMTSTDVGISEPGAVGESIQLSGSGSQASDFTWGGPTTESPGAVNSGQTLSSSGESGVLVTLTVEDQSGNVSTCTAIVTVEDNFGPNALCKDITVELDDLGQATIVAADVDNGSNDACGNVTLELDVTTFNCANIGENTVTLTVTDQYNNESTCEATVTIVDSTEPEALCVGDFSVQLDANGQAMITPEQVDNGSNDLCGTVALSLDVFSFNCDNIGDNLVTLTVTDESNNEATCTVTVTVENDSPQITSLTLPNDPVDISNQVDGSATFDDDNIVSATWDWGDLTTSNGVISGNSISGDHVYGEPGVYEVALTIVDICGLEDTEVFQYVVIYDPSGGFVTGGGWIDSPAGAYVPDPTLTGTANFGFVSKYKKGQTVPDGNTEFQFQAGDLNFKSKEYYWLIVAGKKGKFKGNGTINNEGDYDFMITAIDGGTGNNAGDDKLRMKIWDANSEVVIYDNELGNGETDDPTTVIGGGSIIVHKGKNKNSNSEPIINLVGDEFSVWPNPSSSHFNLKLNLGTNETAQLQVHDVNGKLIYKNGQITSQNYQFGETLVSGLYFATLIQKDQVRTIKLIKR